MLACLALYFKFWRKGDAPYCPKCDMEFVEGIKVCSDCGGPLLESKEVADTMKQKEEQLAVMAQEMDPFSGEMAKTEDADPDEISSAPKRSRLTRSSSAYVDKGQRYEGHEPSASAFFFWSAGFSPWEQRSAFSASSISRWRIPEIHL